MLGMVRQRIGWQVGIDVLPTLELAATSVPAAEEDEEKEWC
jgi:hypothetical protein